MWKVCLLFAGVAVVMVASHPQQDRIVLTNIKPEEVQELLARQNTDLHFAQKIDTIPRSRTSPNGEDQIEDVYESSQFHGQDGLGRYLYGYSIPNVAKVEARNIHGHVRGAYNWAEPSGNVIKVKYWDTGNGFHQVDNLPKANPTQESDAVQRARLAHEKAWKKAATANQVSPSQINLVYKNSAQPAYNNYGQGSRPFQYPEQPSLRPKQQPQNYQSQYNYGQESRPSSIAVQSPKRERQFDYNRPQARNDGRYAPNEEETTSQPHGFFYSFVYPSGIQYRSNEYDAKKLIPHDDIASLGEGGLE